MQEHGGNAMARRLALVDAPRFASVAPGGAGAEVLRCHA